MARNSVSSIQVLVDSFVTQLVSAVEEHSRTRAQFLVLSALGAAPKRSPGRPPKSQFASLSISAPKARKKQLCPVPGCKNPAAPVFGMVCAEHKDVAKAKIKQYRALRRSEKMGGRTGSVGNDGSTKPKRRVSAKVAKTRKLQGRYLGSLRALSAANRAKVKQVAKDSGIAEAVKVAGELASAPS
jgi:hypothetical protein